MPRPSERTLTMPHSAIREMGVLAAAYPDALHLQAGDPDFVTPPHVIEAAAQAARAGFTKYTPSGGLAGLRELCAAKVRERNGIACETEQVVVTTGGCGGLYTSLAIVLDEGDEVLVPDPGWANYPPIVHALGGVPVFYPLVPERGWEPDSDRLAAAVTPRTRVLLVNTPGNPTGAVYDAGVLQGLLELAARHDLWVISDECYDEILFEGVHVSLATLGDPGRVFSVFSCSKSYAMTGWRIGYTVAPSGLGPTLVKAQEPVVGNASSVSQKGAEAALAGPQACVAAMRDAYRARRDAACAQLDALGVGYVRPRGAFYLMVDVSAAGDSLAFAKRLLADEHVAVVPGSAFGPSGEGFVRVSLSCAPEVIEEGLRRLAACLQRLEVPA
jgi:aspartate/methionine/tyrosine aminotransferase